MTEVERQELKKLMRNFSARLLLLLVRQTALTNTEILDSDDRETHQVFYELLIAEAEKRGLIKTGV